MACHRCKVDGHDFCGEGCGLCEAYGETCVTDREEESGEDQNVYPV